VSCVKSCSTTLLALLTFKFLFPGFQLTRKRFEEPQLSTQAKRVTFEREFLQRVFLSSRTSLVPIRSLLCLQINSLLRQISQPRISPKLKVRFFRLGSHRPQARSDALPVSLSPCRHLELPRQPAAATGYFSQFTEMEVSS
jgi:hypothetical protein